MSLVLIVFLTHGIHGNKNLIQKLFFAFLWDIIENIKNTSACIPQAGNFISHHVVFNELFFSYKNTRIQSIAPPTSHVISIFYSWLPHSNSTHTNETKSKILTLPCSTPLPTIPLLTSSSTSSSNMQGSQQLGTALESDVSQLFTHETSQPELEM